MTDFYEYRTDAADVFQTEKIVAACIEHDHRGLFLDGTFLPREFFDLSSGMLGGFIHRLSLYGIRMAVIVPDQGAYSRAFHDFVREANRGVQFRFVPTREEAVSWLKSVRLP